MRVVVEPHPLLQLGAFVATWPTSLGASTTPPWLVEMLTSTSGVVPPGADPRVRDAIARLGGSDDTVRAAVRKLLRHGGYKPSGRGKPASEYLLAAAQERTLGSINLAVDLCNAVSLHAGLPISVVDLDRATEPLRVAIAADDARYVFNPTGQEIQLAGLLCLHDAQGPCANAVKDAQRTKTHEGTTRVVCIVWGTHELAGRTTATFDVYRALTELGGATIDACEIG